MPNEAHTIAILTELQRIGVNLASVSELPGTGLRASELRDWLSEIPDGAGTAELIRRLDHHALTNADRPLAVRWTKEPPRPAHRGRRERDWPTMVLLNAGTDLLMEEWDPFGIRLAGTDREAIAEFAFHLFHPFLSPRPTIDPISHAAGMIESAERDHLALKPSPESHRRYLARRLGELVEQYPVPKTEAPPSAVMVIMTGENKTAPARDPEGVCARCHAFGTVARVTTMTNPSTMKRFCGACWRAVRSDYVHCSTKPPETAAERIAFYDRASEPVWTESRSWDDTIDSLSGIQAAIARDPELAKTQALDLAQIAREIAKLDDVMEGPMPPEVEQFIRTYGGAP